MKITCIPFTSNQAKSQWKDFFKLLFQATCLCQLIQTHRSKSLDHKWYKNFLVRTFFGQVWVSVTLEKSKFRLPRFMGQKLWVVPWSSIYTTSLVPVGRKYLEQTQYNWMHLNPVTKFCIALHWAGATITNFLSTRRVWILPNGQ